MEKRSIKSVTKVCSIYVFFGALWIIFSDKIIFRLASDPWMITKLQSCRGGALVALTSVLLYFLIARELKERDRTEEEVKKKNNELSSMNISLQNEIENRRKTEKDLMAANEKLELDNKAKSRFLANVSHEVRSPMNGIADMKNILNLTELNEEQKKYLSMIKTSSESMLGIINDILDISKIEAGRIELEEEEFKLEDLVQKCMETFEPTARSKGIKLSCEIISDISGSLIGDSGRLKQIIMNLISDAMKYTPKREINIKVEKLAAKKDNIILKFSIGDTGIRIAADKTEFIFDNLAQDDFIYNRKYGGAGLGLAISKKLVELMGGYIGVDNTAEEDSTFYFSVPFRLGNISAGGYAHSKAELRGLRVLIADDDERNRQILKAMLREWGANITLAESSERMNELLKESADKDKKFDILLLDFYMPRADCVQCAGNLGKQPEYSDLTVMMIASVDSDDTVRLMKEIDSCIYAVKPVKSGELYAAIIRALMENRKKLYKGELTRTEKRYSSKKVLVADDNEINQKTVAIMLEAVGIYVDLASNGREAVQLFGAGSYDLILMDVQMPEMDGLSAAARIRQMPKGANIPIIALSTNVLKGDMEKCFDAGMNDCLSKPYTTKELYQKLGAYLGSAAAV